MAFTVNPAGAAVTSSPCDIHERSVSGKPSSNVPGSVTVTSVRPYSRWPVLDTSPPSAAAIAMNP